MCLEATRWKLVPGSDLFGKVAAMGFVLVLSVLGGVPASSDTHWIPALQVPNVTPLHLSAKVTDWPVERPGSEKAEACGHTGWKVAGIIGGIPAGAFVLGLTGLGFVSAPEAAFYVGLGIGALLGGMGGYFLGQLAGKGSLGAKIGIVILDVLAVPLMGLDSVMGLAPAIAAGG